MEIYNISLNEKENNLFNLDINNKFFIIGEEKDIFDISEKFNMPILKNQKEKFLKSNIIFEPFYNLDFLSFIIFKYENKNLNLNDFKIFLGENIIFLLIDREKILYENFLKDFFENIYSEFPPNFSLCFLYYNLINYMFIFMFKSLENIEEDIFNMENKILLENNRDDLSNIIEIRNDCFKLKKCGRQLLYVGDQLVLNDNNFFDEKETIYLSNLDRQINKLYDFSSVLYDETEHLLDLFDSSVNTHTNNLINKLTVFTVFATPITIITGLYGMNFVNMPELRNPYGYFFALALMGLSSLIIYIVLRKNKII